MFRFFVSKKEDNFFKLTEANLRHIKVARIEEKQFICIYEEKFYITILDDERALIIKELNDNHEFEKSVTLGASFIDTKRFEWLIQKAAELGTTSLIPIISINVSKKLPFDIEKKLIRWNEIALNASEQSFRNKPLIVMLPMKFNDVIKLDIPNKYIAHEGKQAHDPGLFKQNSLFLVGPEGGFTGEEVKLASENNFNISSLGKRILRAETASIFMLSRIED
ncbi:MAG: 16S rRNA (uracil(1498)-N(3))-methyltransferase [Mycoplasmataceae bacterium]|nr:16S rRNA (uracil(1498)-N(3))-methyltransferase [Mycoplasmataceae bacterium]